MAHFGKALKALREARHLSQEDLAIRAGLSSQTISNAEQMESPKMRGSNYRKVAEAMGLTTDQFDLAWRTRPPSEHTVKGAGIPIVNQTTAGVTRDYQDVGRDNYSFCPIYPEAVGDPDAFAVQVIGDSMVPEWQTGDILICSPRAQIKSGDACFVQLDSKFGDGNTFKRVIQVPEDRVELRADNPRYPPVIIPRESVLRCVKVVGKFVRYNY